MPGGESWHNGRHERAWAGGTLATERRGDQRQQHAGGGARATLRQTCEGLRDSIGDGICGRCREPKFVRRRTDYARRCLTCCARGIRRRWRDRGGWVLLRGRGGV